jgi:hypothetical protein
MNDIKMIIQTQEIIWDNVYKDSDSIYENIRAYSHYDPYSFKVLPSSGSYVLTIRITPRLEVFTKASVLFAGQLTIDFSLLDTEADMNQVLKYIFKKSHIEFIKAFDEKESSNALNKFRPEFSDEVAESQQRLLLHP